MNVFALITIAIGAHALMQAPMSVRSMVLPWHVLRAVLVFAAAANIGSIMILAFAAKRRTT